MEKSLLSTHQVIAQAIPQIEAIASGTRKLSAQDQSWIDELKRTFGIETLVCTHSEDNKQTSADLLNLVEMEKAPNQKELFSMLLDSLKAIDASTTYSAKQIKLDGVELAAHNHVLASLLKEQYGSRDFQRLFETAGANGVFRLSIDQKTGLVMTSEATENWGMSARQWVTDTVRCGEIEREQEPRLWTKALMMLARFYCQPKEIEAFEQSIADPDFYRRGDAVNGVAHIFLPATLTRDDKWFNNKRLESIGLALKALCDHLKSANTASKEMSVESADMPFVVKAIVYLATYVKAINTDPATGKIDFDSPSAGPWEEMPFAGGLTWDIEAMRAGLESLSDLLFDPQFDSLNSIRKDLRSSKHGDWLKDKKTIDELIEAAKQKVIARLTAGDHPVEHPRRPIDSSLAFISTSTIELADDLDEDVSKHFAVLEFVEKELVRQHGIIRYAPFEVKMKADSSNTTLAPDSYLGANYWIVDNLRRVLAGQDQVERTDRSFGSTDCSSEEELAARAALSRSGQEAQWFMVSVISEGYSNQVARLLASGTNLSEKRMKLIAHGHRKATQFINRSYARVTESDTTGSERLKANGKPCPQFKVPEAYEFVSQANDFHSTTALPGAHTPLAWAASSLYCASRRLRENLSKIDK